MIAYAAAAEEARVRAASANAESAVSAGVSRNTQQVAGVNADEGGANPAAPAAEARTIRTTVAVDVHVPPALPRSLADEIMEAEAAEIAAAEAAATEAASGTT